MIITYDGIVHMFAGKLFARTLETNVRGADFVTFPVADAIRAAFGWGRVVAFSYGVCHTGAAGTRTLAPGGPGTPTAVSYFRPFSHHQTFHSVTPL